MLNKLNITIALITSIFILNTNIIFADIPGAIKDLNTISNQLNTFIDSQLYKGGNCNCDKDIQSITSYTKSAYNRITNFYDREKDQIAREKYSRALSSISLYNSALENLILFNSTNRIKYLRELITLTRYGDLILETLK